MKCKEDSKGYKAGDIVMADNVGAHGNVQQGLRPFLIVSNDIGNAVSPIYCAIPFTTRSKKCHQPTHCFFRAGEGGLQRSSILLAEQITTLNKSDVLQKVGSFNEEQMRRAAMAVVTHIPMVSLVGGACNSPA